MATPLRVFLAAVDPLRRQAVTSALAEHEGLRVVGGSEISSAAATRALECRSHVALVLAGGTPRAALPFISRLGMARPPVETVVTLEHGSAPIPIQAILEAGAHGILQEDIASSDLARALRQVASGAYVLGPDIVDAVMDRARWVQERTLGRGFETIDIEILGLLARGWTGPAAADHLGIDLPTVRSSIVSVKRALGARSQEGAVAAAIRRGII